MKNELNIKIILLSLIVILITASITFANSNISEGQFNITVHNNLVTLKANKVKKSILVSEISKRFGGEVHNYNGNKDEIITIDIKNKPFDIVLKQLLKENYAFVTLGNKLKNINLFQKDNNKSDAYVFPITPDNTVEWSKFNTLEEKIRLLKFLKMFLSVCQIKD